MRAWHVLALYLGVAVAMTWPLATRLGRDVPGDLGDPVAVMWALAWDCEQLLAILRGEIGRVATFFDANIFHPAPLPLAYSEHYLAQAVQVLPLYAVTRNPILCYNLLFLSTFALSGLGAWLFVRELTGSTRAALVSGLLFAFAPYRFAEASHLQVLSAQWMPFALYGLRRYFDSGQVKPLTWAALALVAQNLSSAYYLLFFSPFAAAYVLWEAGQRGAWRQRRTWAQLAAAGAVVTAVTLPLVLPYGLARNLLQLERSRGETIRYSADVYSYGTAHGDQPLWGDTMRAFPKPEGALFPGVVVLLLALAGIFAPRREADQLGRKDVFGSDPRTGVRPRYAAGVALGVAAAVHLAAAVLTLLYRRIDVDLWLVELRMSNVTQLVLRAVVLTAVGVAISPSARARASGFFRTRGCFAVAVLAAAWLSLGPEPQALGRPLDLVSPFGWLYEHVPGFEAVRVPARFAMIVALMLSVLAGFGAAALTPWRHATPALVLLALIALAESLVPMPINGMTPSVALNTPEPRISRAARAPAIYRAVAMLPPGAALAELPLGDASYDVRAMFYSTAHWHKVLNGYSGFFPPHYAQLTVALSDVPRHTGAALDALDATGATHVLIHEGAWRDDQGVRTTAALLGAGATEMSRHGTDVLLALRPPVAGGR